jgi:hypothetical protein
LDGPCNEWEACMAQDASAIMKVQISARNVAEIMNEFVGVLTFKTWVSHGSHPTTAVVSQQLTTISRASFSRSSWWQSSLATSALGSSANLHSPTQRSRQSLYTRRRQSPPCWGQPQRTIPSKPTSGRPSARRRDMFGRTSLPTKLVTRTHRQT